jgi:hypothetical protein
MRQEHRWRIRRACLAVENLHTIQVDRPVENRGNSHVMLLTNIGATPITSGRFDLRSAGIRQAEPLRPVGS